MNDKQGADRAEEPQEERGPKGSRDTGSDQPSGGPADRSADSGDERSDSGVEPRKASDPDAPDLQSGGG
jgi:hypothetical protein